ncbi:dihydroorotate dehydrogenase-like protein [Parabacteroides sp. FAFU027]|uniref:dihydroorotate dehydrogenase-like protein n=1 Tax=Parabacteroides sp. FAFU027 TaxID=2922715 RepID=UPI001FAFD73C|nr:dihydroorotate dehydrogenase-like protein [Parabacteroides sp. FAFU027]
MKNLETHFMGIKVNNPIIVGASNLSLQTDNLKLAEEQGAAAIVFKSLFEEQIQLESLDLDEKLTEFNDIHAEMLTIHPFAEHAGAEEHLLMLRKAKEAVTIPVIASLNAVNTATWVEYAKLIAQTGVDGIELDFYQTPCNFDQSAHDIEKGQIEVVTKIKQNISIPVSVKLSPDYTNALNFIRKLDEAGANAFVLFNSFFQPDIDIHNEKHIKRFNFSHTGDYRQSLRFAGLLYNNIQADLCCSHGVFSGADMIKLILSGASSIQVVSALYKSGIQQISKIKKELEEWMDEKNYNSIDEFRGKLSNSSMGNNSVVYSRAQYVDLLLNSENIFGKEDDHPVDQPHL